MKTIKEVEREIIEAFGDFPTVDEKYAHLFQLGKELPKMTETLMCQSNLVKGCQSKVWFSLIEDHGHFTLSADSDSMVMKGIAALLVQLVQDRTADEISQITLNFLDELNIWKLPSERNNGLSAMLDHLYQETREISGLSSVSK